jgi:hypothetical protein
MKQIYNASSRYQKIHDHKKTRPSLRTLVVSLLLVSAAGKAIAATNYTMVDFTNVGSGGFVPTTIKANGQVFGHAATPTIVNQVQVSVPQLYDIANGSVTNLDTLLNGDIFVSASAINVSGQAIGQVLPAASTTGVSLNVFVRNADGSVIDLGTFAGAKTYSRSYGAGINDAGQIFGNSIATSLCDGRAFTGSVITALQPVGTLGGSAWDWSYASGMNAKGQIVGKSSPNGACLLTDTWHAFVSTPTGLIDLHNPAMPVVNPGSGGSTAFAINDSGMAVGEYPYAFGAATRVFPGGAPIMHAVVWDTAAGTYKDLGKPNLASSLRSINATGQIVGAEGTYAAIGSASGSGLTDLNTLVTGTPTGWNFIWAYNISDAGQILASAKDSAGIIHYALLTPSTTAVALPTAPSNLTSTATSSSQIDLAWTDNATNETAQYLERCTGVGCTNFAQIISLPAGATNYADTGLTAGTSYSYRVRAHGTTGDSAYSNIAAAITASPVTPTPTPVPTAAIIAPSGLTSVAISRKSVVLNWIDNSNNETRFLIESCKGLSCTSFRNVGSVGANVTTFTDTGLDTNRNYNYRVRAANTIGKSAYSSPLSVKTLP